MERTALISLAPKVVAFVGRIFWLRIIASTPVFLRWVTASELGELGRLKDSATFPTTFTRGIAWRQVLIGSSARTWTTPRNVLLAAARTAKQCSVLGSFLYRATMNRTA